MVTGGGGHGIEKRLVRLLPGGDGHAARPCTLIRRLTGVTDMVAGERVGYTITISTVTPRKLASKGVIDRHYH
jgi:hypothetical protein